VQALTPGFPYETKIELHEKHRMAPGFNSGPHRVCGNGEVVNAKSAVHTIPLFRGLKYFKFSP
jgi:hypothetical protein